MGVMFEITNPVEREHTMASNTIGRTLGRGITLCSPGTFKGWQPYSARSPSPDAVQDELAHPKASIAVLSRIWIASPQAWLSIHPLCRIC